MICVMVLGIENINLVIQIIGDIYLSSRIQGDPAAIQEPRLGAGPTQVGYRASLGVKEVNPAVGIIGDI